MASIFTRLVDDAGNGVPGAKLTFRRRWSPLAARSAITVKTDVSVTADASGFCSVGLLGGKYRVWIPGWDAVIVTIPDDDGSYLLQDLLGVDGVWVPLNYRYIGGQLQIINADDGSWLVPCIVGAADAPALAINQGNLSPNYRWVGTTMQWINADAATWHAPWIEGTDNPRIALGAAGVSSDDNARINGGRLQLINRTTGQWHTIFLTGSAPVWAVGPGEDA